MLPTLVWKRCARWGAPLRLGCTARRPLKRPSACGYLAWASATIARACSRKGCSLSTVGTRHEAEKRADDRPVGEPGPAGGGDDGEAHGHQEGGDDQVVGVGLDVHCWRRLNRAGSAGTRTTMRRV